MKIGERNVGDIDRAARAVLAIIFIGAYIQGAVQFPWSYIALLVGLILVGTAAYGTCLIYTLFGLSTCPAGKRKRQ
jgi:hypothetical protein